MNDLISKLRKDFEDKEYRHSYVDEFLNAWIATQIKVLREQRGWSQKELAERADMLQPRISALENVNYSSWSVKTLRKFAEAFDLTLHISFESFGDRIKSFDLFGRDYLQRRSFEEDPVFSVSGEQAGMESKALAEGYKEAKQPERKVIDLFAERGQGRSSIQRLARFATTASQERGGLGYETTISQPG